MIHCSRASVRINTDPRVDYRWNYTSLNVSFCIIAACSLFYNIRRRFLKLCPAWIRSAFDLLGILRVIVSLQ